MTVGGVSSFRIWLCLLLGMKIAKVFVFGGLFGLGVLVFLFLRVVSVKIIPEGGKCQN